MQIDIYVEDDIQLLVDYEFEKGTSEILYFPDGSGCPASPDTFTVYYIYFKMKNVTELITKIYGMDHILDLLQKEFYK